MSSRQKILVTYYSATGNTARVARDIAQRLGGDVESIRDRKQVGPLKSMWRAVRKIPGEIEAPLRRPSDYELTIIGTPVWVGQMTPAVRAYLRGVGADLHRVAFFVTSADTEVSRISPALEALSGRKAVACAGFNAHELRDPRVYEDKLSAFVRAVESLHQIVDDDLNTHASAA